MHLAVSPLLDPFRSNGNIPGSNGIIEIGDTQDVPGVNQLYKAEGIEIMKKLTFFAMLLSLGMFAGCDTKKANKIDDKVDAQQDAIEADENAAKSKVEAESDAAKANVEAAGDAAKADANAADDKADAAADAADANTAP